VPTKKEDTKKETPKGRTPSKVLSTVSPREIEALVYFYGMPSYSKSSGDHQIMHYADPVKTLAKLTEEDLPGLVVAMKQDMAGKVQDVEDEQNAVPKSGDLLGSTLKKLKTVAMGSSLDSIRAAQGQDPRKGAQKIYHAVLDGR